MTRPSPFTVMGAEPSLLRGGPTACLLLHGFTAQPEEMRFLAGDLHRRGYTVLSARLAGHGTRPRDLGKALWTDWLITVEEGLGLLDGLAERSVLIGQSMGGGLALIAAARYPTASVVALSTPYTTFPPWQVALARGLGWSGWMISKHSRHHPELGARREADYPAYARFPLRVIPELADLSQEMRSSLPLVRVPALVIQSRQDFGGRGDLEKIYAALGSARKEKLWVEGAEHSLVRSEKRTVVFEAIAGFLAGLNA